MGSVTRRRGEVAFALCLAAFVGLGLPDAVLGVAWPSLRRAFALPVDALGVLLGAGVSGYVVSSFFAGPLTRRLGVGGLLVASTALVAAATAGCALAPRFALVAGAAFLGGGGGGAIDAAINTYAARHFPAGRVAWLHASWGAGAALGPIVMTGALAGGRGWRAGYATVSVLIGALAVAFVATRRLWDDGPAAGGRPVERSGVQRALAEPRVRAHAALFLLYAGVEAAAGQWAYSLFTEGRGMDPAAAGLSVSGYWASLTAGRLVSGALARWIEPDHLLRVATAAAPVCAAAVAWGRGPAVDAVALALLGFAAGPVFPLLIAATPERVGPEHAADAVGIQVSASAVGVAALPALAGLVAGRFGLEAIGVFITCCALAVLGGHEVVRRGGR